MKRLEVGNLYKELAMYFVLGYDVDGKVLFLTRYVFEGEEEARKYAGTCASGWKAFLVKVL